ncbi:HNH endonuclease [Scytonema sp. UIC 10036]|uniref:HNH endonuclease n=1 Tax=Scytonema sp. UIC 10036 TaxID=2304196 RepID=UPI0012DA0BEF|nr:HNH endonuclease [Scytonema sp. UIC 10036]MUG97909.1 HNH endonuclease [Scytonema sp. UIC 10036]
MDFFNQAKQFADSVGDKIQEVTNNAIDTIDSTVNTVKLTASEMTDLGIAKVNELKEFSTTSLQPGLEVIQNIGKTLNDLTATAVGMTASGMVVADALKDLPRTAEELAREMPKIANRLRYRAGVRVGDLSRSDADVMKLFEKIPGTSKLGASEANIRQFLADKHGSHIIPRSYGGTNAADNILWEVGIDNLRRGAQTMAGGEQVYIRLYNAVDSIVKNSATIAKLGVTATVTAVLTQAVVTAISYSLDLYRGDITVEQYKDLILQETIKTGIAAPIIFLVLVAVLAIFPEFTVLLSAPLVVAGFNAAFGISIALPIIQSIVRHIEAGGFSENVAVD